MIESCLSQNSNTAFDASTIAASSEIPSSSNGATASSYVAPVPRLLQTCAADASSCESSRWFSDSLELRTLVRKPSSAFVYDTSVGLAADVSELAVGDDGLADGAGAVVTGAEDALSTASVSHPASTRHTKTAAAPTIERMRQASHAEGPPSPRGLPWRGEAPAMERLETRTRSGSHSGKGGHVATADRVVVGTTDPVSPIRAAVPDSSSMRQERRRQRSRPHEQHNATVLHASDLGRHAKSPWRHGHPRSCTSGDALS